jgi:hypothetical protein
MTKDDFPRFLNKSEIKHVDMSPDDDLPLRILRAYREDCNSRWEVSGVSKAIEVLWDAMNAAQEQRAVILDRAIAWLERQTTGKV